VINYMHKETMPIEMYMFYCSPNKATIPHFPLLPPINNLDC